MSVLYHYTNVEAFLSILHSRVLWLSDAQKLNDTHEGKWADQIVFEFLSRKKPSLIDREKFEASYAQNRPTVFIASLSSGPDILSQWRAYADDGLGVCIGFDTDYFPAQSPRFGGAYGSSGRNIGLFEVLYDYDHQWGRFDSLYKECIDTNVARIPSPALFFDAGAQFAHAATVMKNPAFREEAEWRIVHWPVWRFEDQQGVQICGTDLKIGQRVARKQIVTHFELPLAKFESGTHLGAIQEVWLGPRCLLSDLDVKFSLALNGWGASRVERSKATYR